VEFYNQLENLIHGSVWRCFASRDTLLIVSGHPLQFFSARQISCLPERGLFVGGRCSHLPQLSVRVLWAANVHICPGFLCESDILSTRTRPLRCCGGSWPPVLVGGCDPPRSPVLRCRFTSGNCRTRTDTTLQLNLPIPG
jgi:hypothetical protein